jgi:hypothetical protein
MLQENIDAKNLICIRDGIGVIWFTTEISIAEKQKLRSSKLICILN